MSSPHRQLWIDGVVRVCDHAYEDICSSDGKILYGGRCTRCGFSFGIGRCDGCSKTHRQLTIATEAGERFCNQDCKDALTRERTAAARRKAAAALASRQKGYESPRCEHRRTEDVCSPDGVVLAARCLDCLRPVSRIAAMGGSTR